MPPSKNGCSAAMMNMQFHQNVNDPLLFASLYTCSAFWYIVLCGLVIMIGVCNEYAKLHRRRMLKKRNGIRDSPTLDPLITNKAGSKKSSKDKGAVTVLTFFTLTVDYLLMLVVMTFNYGYFFATILGLVLGKYLFSFDDESDSAEGRQLSDAPCC